MILSRIDSVTSLALDSVTLPDEMLWEDEFGWTPTVRRSDYSLTGALLVEVAQKKAGRPITLRPPDNEMAWVDRATVEKILTWGAIPDLRMLLQLQYPSDTRSFTVALADGASPISANPVKGFPGFDPGDWFQVSLSLVVIA